MRLSWNEIRTRAEAFVSEWAASSYEKGETQSFYVVEQKRAGRDLKRLVTAVGELRARRIGLRVLAGAGDEIDTATANGRLVFGIFAALAESDRELIIERTRAVLTAARAKGRMGGRPRKMDVARLRMAMRTTVDRDTIAQDLVQHLGITAKLPYFLHGRSDAKLSA